MKTILDCFRKINDEQLGSYEILVLKGFCNKDLTEISRLIQHVRGQLPFDDHGKLDLSNIQKSFIDLISGLAKATTTKPLFLEFESFIQLATNINLEELNKRFLIVENNLLNEYPNQSNVTSEDFEYLILSNREIPEDSPFYKFYSNATKYKDKLLVQYINGLEDEFSCLKSIKLFDRQNINFTHVSPNEKIEFDYQFQFRPLSQEYLDLKINLFFGVEYKSLKFGVDKTIKQQKEAYEELGLFASVLANLEIDAGFFLKDDRLKAEYRQELNVLLEEYWNSDTFRNLSVYKDPDISNELIEISQASVIEEVIQQYENGKNRISIRDIFLTAPTGAGKSLLFQLPAIYLAEKYNAVTIVVSPLIALMKDQVIALKTDRKYPNVAYINSELSLIEREDILNKVHRGGISILYLSPELLLSYELSMFLGERELGLLVIDEAHLVTTWGRDFRVDYWYLGTYIRRIRKYYNYKFPVLAVTATAVYNGPNDMAFETLDSLSMENAIMYIGKVTRDDIEFDINELEIVSSHEKEKVSLTAQRIEEYIDNHKKTIVYCPWTSHISPIREMLGNDYRELVGLYYGGLDKEIKNETYEQFKSNRLRTILSTKAFGMGVDIDDITTVYHHAPSGHLADYVQEIGRAARKKGLIGTAITDFNIRDLKFTKILYGLSSIKQFQVQMVLEKLIKVFNVKKKRNLLVSIEDFQYIFKAEEVDIEQKVKSCLLLLEKDLLAKYQYNVLIARPKSLFTSVFVRINTPEEGKFLAKYREVSHYFRQPHIEQKGQKVYTIELDKIWEKYYSDKSFPLIKKAYFDKKLFENDGIYVSPQIRLIINLNNSADKTFSHLSERFAFIENSLADMGTGFFTKVIFAKALERYLDNRILARRIADLILSIYSSPPVPFAKGYQFSTPECFIQQKQVNLETQYRVFNKAYPAIKASMRKRFHRMFGELNPDMRNCIFFLPIKEDKNIGMIHLAFILEAFDLATYEISGGEKPGIFIRLNDPVKLDRLAKRGYSNDILREIDRRQKTSVEIMTYFFTHRLTTKERWGFIEEYFLGTPADELIGREVPHIIEGDEE